MQAILLPLSLYSYFLTVLYYWIGSILCFRSYNSVNILFLKCVLKDRRCI